MMNATQTTPQEIAVDEKKLHAAISMRARPPRPNALQASFTFGWRAVLKIKHVPMQLFDVTMFPIIMTLMFTYIFGGALGGTPEKYIQFFLPGILVQTVVFITMYTGVALNTDISKGIFDRFRSLPLWGPAVLVGALLGDAIRYSIASLVVIALGFLIGFRPEGGIVGVVSATLLLLVFSFSLSWIWTMLSLILPTPDSVMSTSTMILFPLTFASNVFAKQETMPDWLQVVVNINPITLLVTTSRDLMHGTATVGQVGWVLVACAGLIAVFAPITMYFYTNKAVR